MSFETFDAYGDVRGKEVVRDRRRPRRRDEESLEIGSRPIWEEVGRVGRVEDDFRDDTVVVGGGGGGRSVVESMDAGDRIRLLESRVVELERHISSRESMITGATHALEEAEIALEEGTSPKSARKMLTRAIEELHQCRARESREHARLLSTRESVVRSRGVVSELSEALRQNRGIREAAEKVVMSYLEHDIEIEPIPVLREWMHDIETCTRLPTPIKSKLLQSATKVHRLWHIDRIHLSLHKKQSSKPIHHHQRAPSPILPPPKPQPSITPILTTILATIDHVTTTGRLNTATKTLLQEQAQKLQKLLE